MVGFRRDELIEIKFLFLWIFVLVRVIDNKLLYKIIINNNKVYIVLIGIRVIIKNKIGLGGR